MTNDRAAFIRAIIAAPDDDTVRLAFADWLDDRGETERAEFIRLQCHIASLDPSDYTYGCPLHRREQELLQSFQPGSSTGRDLEGTRSLAKYVWSCPVAMLPDLSNRPGWPIVHAWTFRRGLVEEITCTWPDWRQYHEAILAATPLRKVRLTTMPAIDVDIVSAPDSFFHWKIAGLSAVVDAADVMPGSGMYRALVVRLLIAQWPALTIELPPAPAPGGTYQRGDWIPSTRTRLIGADIIGETHDGIGVSFQYQLGPVHGFSGTIPVRRNGATVGHLDNVRTDTDGHLVADLHIDGRVIEGRRVR